LSNTTTFYIKQPQDDMSKYRGAPSASAALLFGLLSSGISAQASSSSPSCTSYLYTVPSLGTFTNFANYTFSNLDNTLPAGLTASDDTTIGDLPYSQVYEASNVVVRDGFMQLMVPGGQTAAPYSSAQVMTEETDIMYASVRTTAILASPAGTVNGESTIECVIYPRSWHHLPRSQSKEPAVEEELVQSFQLAMSANSQRHPY
jgi:hypothetical protein